MDIPLLRYRYSEREIEDVLPEAIKLKALGLVNPDRVETGERPLISYLFFSIAGAANERGREL